MHHLIDKLEQAATHAERGEPYSVTKLSAVIPLAAGRARCAHFMYHLLTIAREDVLAGRSLSAHHELPPAETAEWLDQARELFLRASAGERDRPEPEVIEAAGRLHDRIEALKPGFKRVWIHATRRQLEDADLLLAEWGLWWLGKTPCLLDGRGAYETARFFVTSYRDKRFHVPPESAPRWREIHRYWAEQCAKPDA